MMTVRMLWVMSFGLSSARETWTPKRDANLSTSSRSPVRKVQRVRSASSRLVGEDGRRVGDWVETDRDEVHRFQRGILVQLVLNGNEVTVDERAERRQRALGVDEGHGDRCALEIAEASGLLVLIKEFAVRHLFTRLEQFEA
jgi:hypothetical protein